MVKSGQSDPQIMAWDEKKIGISFLKMFFPKHIIHISIVTKFEPKTPGELGAMFFEKKKEMLTFLPF